MLDNICSEYESVVRELWNMGKIGRVVFLATEAQLLPVGGPDELGQEEAKRKEHFTLGEGLLIHPCATIGHALRAHDRGA